MESVVHNRPNHLAMPYIMLRTQRAIGQSIKLTIVAEGKVQLEGLDQLEVSATRGESRSYTLTSQEVVLSGHITELNCSGNRLTYLDLSHNSDLQVLFCGENELLELDLSSSAELEALYCGENRLQSLDASPNGNLRLLYCNRNQLRSLNLPQSNTFEWLSCGFNQLTDLDVTEAHRLKSLYCDRNDLGKLDVSSNPLLTELNCFQCSLAELDVSANRMLDTLVCGKNNLRHLDVGHCRELRTLACHANELRELEIQGLDNLRWLTCYRNPLSTYSLNRIYAQLPDLSYDEQGTMTVAYSYTDDNIAQIRASASRIARERGWRVIYRRGGASVLTSRGLGNDADYGFSISGEMITADNFDALDSIPGISGSIYYDPDTNTLTLEDVIIRNKGDIDEITPIINLGNTGMTIELRGHNVIQDVLPLEACIELYCDTRISGDGTLDIYADDRYGIQLHDDVTLTVDSGAEINIDSSYGGICGWGLTMSEQLIVEQGTLKVVGAEEGAIFDFRDIILGDCQIIHPQQAHFSPEKNAVLDVYGEVAKEVIISEG
ncbi:MAG: leucine-rich repeat domain-containing protein [Porphyromonadaceae bacterium]|nr:leucine-rich repeat domain-containing protein [Porphyromonadaceae bacterium]